jgi:hypothetical protein
MDKRKSAIRSLQSIRRSGVDWLLGQLNPDGSIGNPEEGFHYYRAPWTFSITGESTAAAAICEWIRRNMLTLEGKIEGPFRVFRDAYAYRNSTLMLGAHLARQYDLSYGLMSDLLTWRDPGSGGFHNDQTEDGGKSDRMDIPYTCGPGLAGIALGRLDIARSVATFLQGIYDAQTGLPEQFYYAWSSDRGELLTTFPEEEKFWHLVDNKKNRPQRWTIGGIAAGFLCRLYLADPRPEYLALARRYQAFSMDATDGQFNYAQVCKSSWGSSLLYQITGEEVYLDWSCRMADWYVETQRPEGFWYWKGYEKLGLQIELTLEFVMHVENLASGLASR